MTKFYLILYYFLVCKNFNENFLAHLTGQDQNLVRRLPDKAFQMQRHCNRRKVFCKQNKSIFTFGFTKSLRHAITTSILRTSTY